LDYIIFYEMRFSKPIHFVLINQIITFAESKIMDDIGF